MDPCELQDQRECRTIQFFQADISPAVMAVVFRGLQRAFESRHEIYLVFAVELDDGDLVSCKIVEELCVTCHAQHRKDALLDSECRSLAMDVFIGLRQGQRDRSEQVLLCTEN